MVYEAIDKHIRLNGSDHNLTPRTNLLSCVTKKGDDIINEALDAYSKSIKKFDFLRPKFADIAECAENAETKVVAASETPREMRYAIIEIGLLAEKIARLVYIKQISKYVSANTTQESLLNDLKSVLPDGIFKIFDGIRRQRNSIHDNFRPFDIKKYLRDAYILSYWFVNVVEANA